MVNYGSIIVPLYIYPYPLSRWQPLFDAATNYPNVNFTAVVNPYSGPDPAANGCPNNDYVAGIAALNAFPNINTMGYVHTSSSNTCGPQGTYFCPASEPLDSIKANITTYANWGGLSCVGWGSTPRDVHIDSIFVDEAPGQDNGANLTYMSAVADFARASGFNASNGHNGLVLFNPGYTTDLRYFDIADQIIIFEETQANYDALGDIDGRTDNGARNDQASAILHHASTDPAVIASHVQQILGDKAFASLYITNLPNATQNNIYGDFGTNWPVFVDAVNSTVAANQAA